MFAQSFKYIASVIHEYFNNVPPQPGERFHVYTEKPDEVKELYSALCDGAEYKFSYGGYKSRATQIENTKLMFVASHNATESFLTRLRNSTASQSPSSFEGAALLTVHDTSLDSIVGGSQSLNKEGAPLHIKSLKSLLKRDLEGLDIHPSEKLALVEKLHGFNSTIHEDHNAILAYYPFMNIIQHGQVEPNDWIDLGLFADPELDSINDKKIIKKRLDDNQYLFEITQNSHKYGNPAEDLVKQFIHAGVKELSKSTWEELTYGKVKKWRDERGAARPPEYLGHIATLLDLEFWERKEGTTSAARRKRHIIIFNPDHLETVDHKLAFDKSLKQTAISIGKNGKIVAEHSSNHINVTIKDCGVNAVIGQVTYDDENASGKHIFNIAVLPFASGCLESHRSTYFVKGRTQSLRFSADGLIIFNDTGESEQRVTLSGAPLELSKGTKIVAQIDESLDLETLKFNMVWDGSTIPCELAIDTIKPVSISGLNIWKTKRESKKSFKYLSDNKLVFGNDEFFTNRQRTLQFLDIEKQIISEFSNYCYWKQDKNELTPNPLDIDSHLLKAFTALTSFYSKSDKLPSLTSLYEDDELITLMKKYVAIFLNLLDDIVVGQPLDQKTHNLLKVGTVERNGGQEQICFTPFHPLNVVYQLYIHGELENEIVPEEILRCLSANDLLPYVNGDSGQSDKYCSVLETELPEWSIYRPFRTIHRGWHDEYVHKLIAEKIFEYKKHFPYLFTGSVEAPVNINLINLGDCIDALNGVVRYFKKAIDLVKGDASKIHPLSIRIYEDQSSVNKFEEFALYSTPEKIEQDFEISLKTKSLDEYDVLKVIREKLDFYIKPKSEEPEYAHLTFFKFEQESTEWTYHNIGAVKTGCSIGGLVNAVPSIFSGDEYITGFGSKYCLEEGGDLLDFVSKFNALARVANTSIPYSPNEATFATLKASEKERLDGIYEKSNWVTFIDPKVDLNFFKTSKDAKDLIIIHYSDQYNNTSGYDAITVTRKSKQYKSIIHEYLANSGVTVGSDDELKLINMFNAINGDWLLQLISSRRSHFSREKISILSAVNTMLAVLKHPDIVWIPLSLEEILRVSGSVGLKKSEGIFSAKNLGSLGAHCDDLLMAGVELRDQEVHVHLYPVEVKIGGDQSQKAKEQSVHTANVLKEHLSDDTFRSKFYRNFFAKLIIVGAEKMALYDIYSDKEVELITDKCRAQLLNDKFSVSWDLQTYIGKAGVLSFKDAKFSRKLILEQQCLIIEMLESDGYANMLQKPQQLLDLYNDQNSTVSTKYLLSNAYKQFVIPPVEPPVRPPIKPPVDPVPPIQTGMNILFGHDVNTKEPVTWEPNNTNKVMHTNTGIIGTMGTGKTQFTKSLVTQLVWESKNNVNQTNLGFLIFDYKGDYIKEDFMQATNAKRYDLHKLPFNPLALTVGDTVQPMLPLHTANAIKESISTAFGLGIVQKQRLRDCIMDAYSSFGIDKANKDTWQKPAPTIANVCEEYLNSDDVKSDSLYAALDNLHQFEIFESDPDKTVSLWSLLDDVVVINLAGYDKDIQNLVVAITLDQFYSQMQKAGHSAIEGDYREISKMVLVDEADNFLSQKFQSIRKILKEGREFGVGTILSTQFLNHFSTGDDEFSNYILTWVAHCVSEINKKDIVTLFGKQPNSVSDELMAEISGLGKHISICNIGDGKPLKIQDKAFWQLSV